MIKREYFYYVVCVSNLGDGNIELSLDVPIANHVIVEQLTNKIKELEPTITSIMITNFIFLRKETSITVFGKTFTHTAFVM